MSTQKQPEIKTCGNCYKIKHRIDPDRFAQIAAMDPKMWDWSEIFNARPAWMTKRKETGGFLDLTANNKVVVVHAHRGGKFKVMNHHGNSCPMFFHVHPQYAAPYMSSQDMYVALQVAIHGYNAWSVLVSDMGVIVFKPNNQLLDNLRNNRTKVGDVMKHLRASEHELNNRPWTFSERLNAFMCAGFHIVGLISNDRNEDQQMIPHGAEHNKNFFV